TLAKGAQANEVRDPTEQIGSCNQVHPIAFCPFESLAKQRRVRADSFLPVLLRPAPERNAPAYHLLNDDRDDTGACDLRGRQSLKAIVKRRHQATKPLTNRRINVGTSQPLWSICYLVERFLFSRKEELGLIVLR